MKTLNGDELDVLTRLAAATPDDVELIISGGWAARLHRLHPWSTDVTFAPLLTKDLDVAVREGTASGAALLSGLRAQGFKDAPRGDEKPPIESYLLEDRPEFELEFITDLQGGSSDRHGNSRRTVAISGVTAHSCTLNSSARCSTQSANSRSRRSLDSTRPARSSSRPPRQW